MAGCGVAPPPPDTRVNVGSIPARPTDRQVRGGNGNRPLSKCGDPGSNPGGPAPLLRCLIGRSQCQGSGRCHCSLERLIGFVHPVNPSQQSFHHTPQTPIIERRFRLSRLHQQHSIDSFHFKHHKSRTELKSRILRLLDPEFIAKGTGAIFIGNSDPATL